MQVPIIREKVTIPPLASGYLPRGRLDRLWDGWDRQRIVLVAAGAGFGKTSFLAANARRGGAACGWFCVDEADVDLARFGAHFLEAVAAGSDPREAAPDPTDPDYGQRLLASVIAQLRESPRGRRLVIDDAHLVARAAPVVGFLEHLVRYWPETATLILASREPLGVTPMRIRARGATAFLTAHDLEFRPAEVAALFGQRFPGTKLDHDLLRDIVHATEGWAAGLEIFCQALEGTSAEMVRRTLERFSSGGSGWFAYFAEEVVGGLDDRTQTFLLGTAEMPRLEAALCDRVLGIGDSQAILEQLVGRNLFTFRLDGEDASYRYHHLFRAFLRESLRRRWSAAQLRQHRRRIAAALARAGAWPEAAAAYAEAGDAEATLRLVERRGEGLLATGRYEVVRAALAGVPPRELSRRPRALFVRARLLDFQGYWEEAEAAYRRALRICPAGPRRADLYSLIAQSLSRRGRYREARELCRKAMAESGRTSPPTQLRILIVFGVSACEMGRIAEGERYLRRAQAICRRRSDAVGVARFDYLLAANVHRPRGEFRLAQEVARRALVVFRRERSPRRACIVMGVLADLAAEQGDFHEARELAEEALRRARELGLRAQSAYCRHILGRCDLAAGDLARAREHLTTALREGEEIQETDLLSFPRLALAQLEMASGDASAAGGILRQAVAVARRTRDPLQEAQAAILLGQLAGAANRARAARWWPKAERTLRRIGARFELHRLLLLRLDAGDVPRRSVVATLRELITGVERCGHAALFLTFEPERAARVLAHALEQGVDSAFARDLLVRLGPAAVEQVVARITPSEDRVRVRGVEILAQIGGPEARRALERLAHAGDPPGSAARLAAEELRRAPVVPLRIAALGRLRIGIGDRELSLADWKSSRALRLFQVLLVHRFRWVPRDQVAEALWPEVEAEKAANSLWQTVRVLRLTLEPDLREARESHYIRFENDAYRLEPGEGHDYDVRRFEALLREGEARRIRGKPRAAETCFREAWALYGGDFLAESPYEEFATAEREQLRDGLLRASTRLLEFYAGARRWAEVIPLCRQGLEHDPYREDFHHHLTQAHLRMGHRREALAAYQRYEETMVGEMDLLPAPRMQALAALITPLRTRGPGTERAPRPRPAK